MRSLPILVLLFLTLAIPAFASDGVLEINQTCVVQTGCFPGDGVGFPVSITASGSYRFTSNVTVPNGNTTAIIVSVDDVSIDLGGFTLRGPNQCSAPPVTCQLAGNGLGVDGRADRLHVSNGSVVGLGSVGIYALSGNGYEIRDVRVSHNRYQGVRIDGSAAVIDGITATRNGEIGIWVGAAAKVSDNTAYQNGSDGIRTATGSNVSGNTANENGASGIVVLSGSIVSGNTANRNGADGINGSSAVSIIGNTAYDNGDVTNSDLDDGIDCGSDCIVRENIASENEGYGLRLFIDSAYSDNVLNVNATGTVTGAVGSANNRGGNYCVGTGTVSLNCP